VEQQFYYYVVEDWLKGDLNGPPPPESRSNSRNHEWIHLFNNDVLSMQTNGNTLFAAWDLAFRNSCMVDPDFATST